MQLNTGPVCRPSEFIWAIMHHAWWWSKMGTKWYGCGYEIGIGIGFGYWGSWALNLLCWRGVNKSNLLRAWAFDCFSRLFLLFSSPDRSLCLFLKLAIHLWTYNVLAFRLPQHVNHAPWHIKRISHCSDWYFLVDFVFLCHNILWSVRFAALADDFIMGFVFMLAG